jgi:hypothetical protein
MTETHLELQRRRRSESKGASGRIPGHAITDVIVRTRSARVEASVWALDAAYKRAVGTMPRTERHEALVELAAVAVAWADELRRLDA